MTGYRYQDIPDALDTGFDAGCGMQVGRKFCAGKIAGVFGIRRHFPELRLIAAPQAHLAIAACKLQCQCSTP